MQKWSQPFWMQVLHRDLSKSDFKIELGRSFQAPFARKGTHMNVNKSDLLKSAKQAESSARELLDKVASLNTEVGASLQGAKRLESKVIAKEREEAEARERLRQEEKRRQFFDSEEQHGVFVSDRDMPGSDDKPAETVQTRVHDAVEAPSEEKETAIKPTKEESEKVKTTEKQAEKPVTEEKDSEKKVETALLSRKEEGSEKRIEAEEIPVNENVSEDTENREQGSKSVADENGAEQHEQESKQQTNSDTEEMAENVIQEKNDRQNSTGRQPGGDRQNRSDRTDRRVRDDRRTGRDNRDGREQGRVTDTRSQDRTRTASGPDGIRNDTRSENRIDRPRRDQRTGDGARSYNSGTRTTGFDRTNDRTNDRGDRPAYSRTGERRDNRDGQERRSFDRSRPMGDRSARSTDYAGKDKDKDEKDVRSRGNQQRSSQAKRPSTSVASIIPQPTRDRSAEQKSSYVKTFDTEKKAKNKKTIMKETAPSSRNWEDDGQGFGSKKRKTQKQQEQHKPEPVVIDKAVITTDTITVRSFSEKIGKPAAEIIKKLFMMGIVANINQDIDFDTCELIAMDYGIELEHQVAKSFEEVMEEGAGETDSEENLITRPPVVTIMGHVDHGKTSLLDAIRNSAVTATEAGGITQHIGAYTVSCNGRSITFIDTPGHEAFTSMRARGAQVTDVVILVVAADDGIMPQTVEAINHSKAAGVPIIVAINKIDKPEANPDRVKQQLTEHGLVCEDWGGDTICVPVSAKKQQNLDTLLEMVLLQADVLELRANPNREARGTIIEAQLDRGRGPVATVLVQNGTLKIGDPIVAGVAYGRVRAMIDDKGRTVKAAGPSQPVEVLGFNEVPSAGDIMYVADVSKKVAEERRNKIKAEQLKSMSKVSLEDLFSHIADGEIKTLNIVIKADVHGSVEAVRQALEKLSNDEVRVKCIHGGVGAINESDIMFASASNAIVIGFNVRPDGGARSLAEQEKVDVRTYRIIYQAIEDVENAMKGLFKPVYKEVHLGNISVRNTFKVSGVGVIAGAYVQEGKVQRNALVRVVRDGVVIHEGQIASLRRFKDDVKEVASGYECGIGIENFNDIHEGDVIEAYMMEEVKR